MEEMGSFRNYQEGVDEMRQKFLCSNLQFQQFKAETIEELRKKNEYVCQLIQLLKDVSKERDEARDQLQKLLNKVLLPSSANTSCFPLIQNECPVLLKPTKASNSSINELNILSEAPVNYNSHGSSPIDSFFDIVSSPDTTKINMADSNNNLGYQPLIQDSNLKASMEMPEIDHATLMIDKLVEGKPLPQKGKFLQAVLEAPQPLHSLFLAGPLPKWRNPPRLQTFQLPHFAMQKDPEVAQEKPGTNLSFVGSSTQLSSTPILNFTSSASCLGAINLGASGANMNNFFSLSKRQRLQ